MGIIFLILTCCRSTILLSQGPLSFSYHLFYEWPLKKNARNPTSSTALLSLSFLILFAVLVGFQGYILTLFLSSTIFSCRQVITWEKIVRKSVSGWIPDWFPKVEKEESRKWEPVDGIQEKITDVWLIIFRTSVSLLSYLQSPFLGSRAL